MKKVLALLSTQSQYLDFALPELKSFLRKAKIPIHKAFSSSISEECRHLSEYQINRNCFKSYPFIVLNIEDFQKQRKNLEQIANRSIMINKLMLLLSSGNNYQQLDTNRYSQIIKQECTDDHNLYSCDFISKNRKVDRQQQLMKISRILNNFQFKGKININNPNKRIAIIQHHEYHPTFKTVNQTLKQVYVGIQLGSNRIQSTGPKFHSKYQLSNRIYLGPTSTDNDLSFLMCNQANIQKNSIVYDPFVGTGSLLIPPSHFGAHVLGSDLDQRILNGISVGRLNKASNYYKQQLQNFQQKYKLNFKQYGFKIPDFKLMDCLSDKILYPQNSIDAIITDPPYGIRARMIKKNKDQNNSQKLDSQVIIKGLLEISNKLLKKDGFLVFLYHIIKNKKQKFEVKALPYHNNFELIDYSLNTLSHETARVLVTMKKN